MWRAPLPLLLLLLLCQTASVTPAAGLECYSCGGLDSDQPGASCTEFREALSWSMFIVRCPEDNVCVKTMSPYTGEFRGCGARQSWFGLRHDLGCRDADLSDSETHFCFCDEELCNAAPSFSRAAPGLGTLLAVAAAAAVAGRLRPHR